MYLSLTSPYFFIIQFANDLTQTQGFVTRDDARKEIIVAFAGSEQIEDALTGAAMRVNLFFPWALAYEWKH